MNRWQEARNQRDTALTADNKSRPWDDEDVAYARDRRHTAVVAAYRLGRTLAAVKAIRSATSAAAHPFDKET